MTQTVLNVLTALGGALIGAIASIIVCVINNNKQNALMFYRLEQLEKKVDKHNHLVERMYSAENKISILEKIIPEEVNIHGH